ncbi:hypothetical protein [Teichococcus wenyumeiae]|uniref:hypothetical protein n=1 Tax=Teichococcus wenyumeiae TaxID=2478470 RepID=UPI0038D0D9CF
MELRRLGNPAVRIDARHTAAALQAGFRNKNDRNDTRGIAELMRVRTYREVWIKSQESQRRGMLLTARGTLHSQRVALENTIRGLLRLEGIHSPTRGSRFAEDVLERMGWFGCLAPDHRSSAGGACHDHTPDPCSRPAEHLDGPAGFCVPPADDDPRRGRAHRAVLQSLC